MDSVSTAGSKSQEITIEIPGILSRVIMDYPFSPIGYEL